MERYENIEIPHIDLPDEITHTNMPEIEIASPHPVVPQPEAGGSKVHPKNKIGFTPSE